MTSSLELLSRLNSIRDQYDTNPRSEDTSATSIESLLHLLFHEREESYRFRDIGAFYNKKKRDLLIDWLSPIEIPTNVSIERKIPRPLIPIPISRLAEEILFTSGLPNVRCASPATRYPDEYKITVYKIMQFLNEKYYELHT